MQTETLGEMYWRSTEITLHVPLLAAEEQQIDILMQLSLKIFGFNF